MVTFRISKDGLCLHAVSFQSGQAKLRGSDFQPFLHMKFWCFPYQNSNFPGAGLRQ
jgi:hypothetical protein